MPRGGARFVKDGKDRWFYDNEFDTAQKQGWKPATDAAVISRDDAGLETYRPISEVLERREHGGSYASGTVAPLMEQDEVATQLRREAEYGGIGGDVAALGLGAASSLTFGGSDWVARGIFGREAVEGVSSVNPFARGAGEIGGVLAGSLIPGGQGAAAGKLAALMKAGDAGADVARLTAQAGRGALARYTPAGMASYGAQRLGGAVGGLKGAVTAEALEGVAYGFGHGVSQLAMKDEPFTAEAMWSELGVNSILGGAVGIGVGGVTHGARKILSRGAKAAEARPPGVLDVESAEGQQFMESVASRTTEFNRTTEELIQSTRQSVGLRPEEFDLVRAYGQSMADLDGTVARRVADLDAEVAPFRKANASDQEGAKELYRKLVAQDDKFRGMAIAEGRAAAAAVESPAALTTGTREHAITWEATTAYNLLRQEAEILQGLAAGAGRPELKGASRKLLAAQQRVDRAVGAVGTPTGARWKVKTSTPLAPEEQLESLYAYRRALEEFQDVTDAGEMGSDLWERLERKFDDLKELMDRPLAASAAPAVGGGVSPFDRLVQAQKAAREAVKNGSASARHAALAEYNDAIRSLGRQFDEGVGDSLKGTVHRSQQLFDDTQRALERMGKTSDLLDAQVRHVDQAKKLVQELKAASKGYQGKGGLEAMFQGAVSPIKGGANLAVTKAYAGKLDEVARHLGIDSKFIKDMMDPMQGIDALMVKAGTPLMGESKRVAQLEKLYNKSRALLGLREGDAAAKGEHIAGFLSKSPRDQAKVVDTLNRLDAEFKVVANAQNRLDLVLGQKRIVDDLVDTIVKTADPTGEIAKLDMRDLLFMAGAVPGLVPNVEGPYDELLKVGLIAHVLKKGGGAMKAKAGSRLLRAATQRAGGRAAATMAGNAARKAGAGPITSALASGGAASATYTGVQRIWDRLAPVSRVAESTGGAMGAIADVVHRLGHTGAKAVTKGSFSAKAVLMANDFGSDEKPKSNELRDLYEHRKDALLSMTDPLQVQQRAAESLTDVSKVHLGLFDKMVTMTTAVIGYLRDKLPKDPGTTHKLGLSRWKETDRDIRAWARHLAGATDPIGVLQRAATEAITPQEAEAVRTLYPAMFAKFQSVMAENLDSLQQNATRNQRINLSILTGVPVDSTMRPNFQKFVQQQYLNRGVVASNMAAEQGKLNSKPSAIKPAKSELTKSQSQDIRRA